MAALRDAVGPRPAVIVTDGVDGLWLDVGSSPHDRGAGEHLPVPWRVEDVATVGAGDILAAFLTMRAKAPSAGWRQHAAAAMQVVAEELESRRSA
jgi:sugar/nucleoside kinase (ribokinase family)